jgi:hypothetical protein
MVAGTLIVIAGTLLVVRSVPYVGRREELREPVSAVADG